MSLASSFIVDQVVVMSSTIRMVSLPVSVRCGIRENTFFRFFNLPSLFKLACVLVFFFFFANSTRGIPVISLSFLANIFDWLYPLTKYSLYRWVGTRVINLEFSSGCNPWRQNDDLEFWNDWFACKAITSLSTKNPPISFLWKYLSFIMSLLSKLSYLKGMMIPSKRKFFSDLQFKQTL